jgi:hypothetical protein
MNERIRLWLLARSKLEWNPKPISPPLVDPELTDLCATQRMIESLRFFVLSTEYWIAPDGLIREWLRVMCKLGLLVL